MRVKLQHINFFKWVFITAIILLLLFVTIVFSLNISIRPKTTSSNEALTITPEDKDWYANAQKELDARNAISANSQAPETEATIAVKKSVIADPVIETTTLLKQKIYTTKSINNDVPISVNNDIASSAAPRIKKEKTTSFNNNNIAKEKPTSINNSNTPKEKTNPYNTSNTTKENTIPNNTLTTSSGKYPRKISQAEIDEFMRQYPNRATSVRFVCFGNVDAEMEGVKLQIINALQQYGYKDINKNWNLMSGYVATDEVHFGGYGYSGVNFYIPAL